jgi:cell division protein ZapB
MSKLQELADRIDRLLLKYQEVQRTNQLLSSEMATIAQERNSLQSRLHAARLRIDTLLERLPENNLAAAQSTEDQP